MRSTNQHPAKPASRIRSVVLGFITLGILAGAGNHASAASLAQSFAPKGSAVLDHSAFSHLLSKYVVKSPDGINRVNYRGLKNEQAKLRTYLNQMQSVKVRSLSSNAAKAYWINLYNAKTLDVVLDHYPVKSIRDINLGGGLLARGPWKKTILNVSGKSLSLDNVEHDIARKSWKDPRLHYGFNCASIGCPNLLPTAFTAKNIDAQLDAAAHGFLNHPRAISAGKKGLTVSKLFKWYSEDFGTAEQLAAHWNTYANGSLKANLQRNKTVKSYRYDWSLNEAR